MKLEKARVSDSPVGGFLLQRYRMFLVRLVATRLANRFMCLAVLASIILLSNVSPLHSLAVILIALIISASWYHEQETLNNLLRGLEETLAQISGSEWEDIYIRSRYVTSKPLIGSSIVRYEPMIWGILIIVLAFTRLILQRSGFAHYF